MKYIRTNKKECKRRQKKAFKNNKNEKKLKNFFFRFLVLFTIIKNQ